MPRSTIPLEERSTSRSVNVPPSIWEPLLDTFPDGEYKHVSDWFRKVALRRLSRSEEEKKYFDCETSKDTLQRLIKKEKDLEKVLRSNILEGGESAFTVLHNLAVSFGSNEELTENTEHVLNELYNYDCSPEDIFNDTDLELFIHYFEKVLERRNLHEQIKRYRRNGQGKKTSKTEATGNNGNGNGHGNGGNDEGESNGHDDCTTTVEEND